MRLMVLIALCVAFGFAGGVFYQQAESAEQLEEASSTSSLDGQVGMGTDMSLFLSTSGILCESLEKRSRSDEIERVGNQARRRREVHDQRLLTELRGESSQIDAINAIIDELNNGLRSRVSGLIQLRSEGNPTSRIEAIDFVIGNLGMIRSAEESFRSELTDEQIERLGDDAVNPFAYLDEEVVQLFHTLTTSSAMP